ncbi:hypothetical protein VCRA2114E365_300032 [Vibrio crassostreae]|uniref:hypothetical protein n=1 Tax=Vibrio crassostreae TaxID=246167 RepID=UPI0006335D8D|nr:hypothetical protein [Vibrio crassostreae]CAK1965408.1 hypothetical protein VCRA2115O371_290032 [Vibrio crassostreae]CAK1969953.1 hypothetical protein VCRA2113O357_280032 [Vibrio crassostreae]CAK1973743.1 hypothetical protein VCRA2113O354_280032 [Vibrio crassostreae]CAK1976710.1 hypothetical protein VCRA2113O358_280028 [Vibrio crassostreae]CAK1976814.1 hypothetical protein VCRA2113O362_290031 [Vibrio crassostreae]
MKNKITYFDPDISFFGLKIVRLAALSFILIFLLVCGIIIHQSHLWGEWNFTHSGFNNLLDYFKVPLGFLALTIPVGAVFAANHRSEQTKKQIALTHNQNLFTNYYKHIEEFDKYASLTLKENSRPELLDAVETLSVRSLHKAFYPKLLVTGSIKVDKSILLGAEEVIKEMLGFVISSDLNDKIYANRILEFQEALDSYLETHNVDMGGFISFVSNNNNELLLQHHMDRDQVLSGTSSSLINSFHLYDALFRTTEVLRILESIMMFDTSYEPCATYKLLESVPEIISYPGGKQNDFNPLTVKVFLGENPSDDIPFTHPIYKKSFIRCVEIKEKYLKEIHKDPTLDRSKFILENYDEGGN